MGAIVALSLGALIYTYRVRLGLALDVLIKEIGSKKAAAACIALGLFLLVCLVFWLLFPILAWFGLRSLRRRTAGTVSHRPAR